MSTSSAKKVSRKGKSAIPADDIATRLEIKATFEGSNLAVIHIAARYGITESAVWHMAQSGKWKRSAAGAVADKREVVLREAEAVENIHTISVEKPDSSQNDPQSPDPVDGPSHAISKVEIAGSLSPDAQKAMDGANAMIARGEDPWKAFATLPEEQRNALSIEVAARRQATVVIDHKRQAGQTLSLLHDITLDMIEFRRTGIPPHYLPGLDAKGFSMLIDKVTRGTKDLIPIERLVHGIDTSTENVERVIPFVDRKAALRLAKPAPKKGPDEGAPKDGKVGPDDLQEA